MLKYRVIGNHIRNARLRMGLSQENVADSIGISATYYGKIERGDLRPNLERLYEICKLLSVPLETVFHGAYPTQTTMTNAPPTDEQFITTIKELCECASNETKAMILRVCQEIVSTTKRN